MTRVRIRFTKTGKIRWTSHRDLARMWERAFRRVQLPLVYSGGFSPRPRVSFGLALPTGHESLAEYLDLELLDAAPGTDGSARTGLDVVGLPRRLTPVLPTGIEATAAAIIDPKAPSLQEEVTSSTWSLVAVPAEGAIALSGEAMAERVEALLAAGTAVVTRQRKGVEVTDDIRPGIRAVHVVGVVGPGPADGIRLEAELASTPRSIRPSELLLALEGTAPGSRALLEERDVRRLHQWISRDGARTEPLPAGEPDVATDAPHAFERVS
jgi:radical SAM-linked protein